MSKCFDILGKPITARPAIPRSCRVLLSEPLLYTFCLAGRKRQSYHIRKLTVTLPPSGIIRDAMR